MGALWPVHIIGKEELLPLSTLTASVIKCFLGTNTRTLIHA